VISRRHWIAAAGAAIGVGTARAVAAQQAQEKLHQATPSRVDSGNLFAMDQDAWRSVRLAPKPGAKPSMTVDERDALEHRLRCQCGCTLDVFTCRTTDFSCQVSPAMHRDVMAMVEGGWDANEITNTFVAAYGDRVLMAPPKVGFNILGYVLPSIGVGVGAVFLMYVIRGFGRPAPAAGPVSGANIDASPEELAKLDAAVRDDA
jgi:cytochrome c-type biogenesis protein CcmH